MRIRRYRADEDWAKVGTETDEIECISGTPWWKQEKYQQNKEEKENNTMATKNLFDFATKELSQDAFLRWLFESWDDPNINNCVKALLKKFCDLEENISSIKTIPQYKKIDIVVEIITVSKQKTALFIEDKTFSNQHDKQLAKYNRTIKTDWSDKGWKTCKVFYKTSKISQDDIEEAEKNGWKPFDIVSVYELYEPHAKTQNEILRQYIDYLKRIKEIYDNDKMPLSNSNKTDYMKWDAYFENVIIPRINQMFPDIEWKSIIVYQSQVVCLRGYKKGTYVNGIPTVPFIEVRSSNCTLDTKTNTYRYKFEARILCYDISDEIIANNRVNIIRAINLDDMFVSKDMKKQIGQSRKPTWITNDNEFIEQLSQHTTQYLKLVQYW